MRNKINSVIAWVFDRADWAMSIFACLVVVSATWWLISWGSVVKADQGASWAAVQSSWDQVVESAIALERRADSLRAVVDSLMGEKER